MKTTKCECYHEQTVKKLSPQSMELYTGKEGRCYGTKECELCTCGGDESKCDFYPEKRKVKMTTAEMWLEAQLAHTSWFKTGSMYYNTKYGFVDLTSMNPWPVSAFSDFSKFMKIDDWTEVDTPIMTKAEAERKFDIKIIGGQK